MKKMAKRTNRIFIWVSYGNVSVFDVSNTSKLAALEASIYDVLKEFDEDFDDRYRVAQTKADTKYLSNKFHLEHENYHIALINFMLNDFGIDTHETFEHGTGFSVMKNPTETE
jgi:hypothetical protein